VEKSLRKTEKRRFVSLHGARGEAPRSMRQSERRVVMEFDEGHPSVSVTENKRPTKTYGRYAVKGDGVGHRQGT
jgi:hypothetical protein